MNHAMIVVIDNAQQFRFGDYVEVVNRDPFIDGQRGVIKGAILQNGVWWYTLMTGSGSLYVPQDNLRSV